MKLMDLIVLAIVAGIILSSLWYIRREKKKGIKCIGCPDSATCSGNCAHCSGCGKGNQQL